MKYELEEVYPNERTELGNARESDSKDSKSRVGSWIAGLFNTAKGALSSLLASEAQPVEVKSQESVSNVKEDFNKRYSAAKDTARKKYGIKYNERINVAPQFYNADNLIESDVNRNGEYIQSLENRYPELKGVFSVQNGNPALAWYHKSASWANERLLEDQRKYDIPFSGKTVKLSVPRENGSVEYLNADTGVIDGLLKYAEDAGMSAEDALGLAFRESRIGMAGKRYTENADGKRSIPLTRVISNWAQQYDILNPESRVDKYDQLKKDKLSQGKDLTQEDVDFIMKYLGDSKKEYESIKEIKENPLSHAKKLLDAGKYNPGDPGYMNKIRYEGSQLMNNDYIKRVAGAKNESIHDPFEFD